MNMLQKKMYRVKNIPQFTIKKDFGYNPFSFIILGIFFVAGILLQNYLYPGSDPEMIIYIAGGILAGGIIISLFPLWSVVIVLTIISWIGMYAGLDGSYWPLFTFISLGLIFSPALELVYQWDKVVILRAGKFKAVHEPGLFFLLPVFDRVAAYVDTRIRATDFSAEKSLTKDTVPVHVDALAFWMIWDAQKAILEVENFMEAVTLSAQTALRDSIGKHDLSTLLSEREAIYKEIKEILDAKTNPWGITILTVEFTDIIIPQALEDAMSKRAQAEREKQSRVILGTAELEVAEKFEKAAERYKNNPTALHLRAMNMVYEGIRQKGSMILLPSSALDTMNLGTTMGIVAMNKAESILNEEKPREEENNVEEKEG